MLPTRIERYQPSLKQSLLRQGGQVLSSAIPAHGWPQVAWFRVHAIRALVTHSNAVQQSLMTLCNWISYVEPASWSSNVDNRACWAMFSSSELHSSSSRTRRSLPLMLCRRDRTTDEEEEAEDGEEERGKAEEEDPKGESRAMSQYLQRLAESHNEYCSHVRPVDTNFSETVQSVPREELTKMVRNGFAWTAALSSALTTTETVSSAMLSCFIWKLSSILAERPSSPSSTELFRWFRDRLTLRRGGDDWIIDLLNYVFTPIVGAYQISIAIGKYNLFHWSAQVSFELFFL